MADDPQSPPVNDNPVCLGLKKSFGFGDRLGLAGAGHLAAARRGDFAPVFAQQSIREMTRTGRHAEEVMSAARAAVAAGGYREAWGADADHLKTKEDVAVTSEAGFCFFTIDPSEHVNNGADTMDEAGLEAETEDQVRAGTLPESWMAPYLRESYPLPGAEDLIFDRETLLRAAVKYGRAIHHCEIMAGWIAEANPAQPFEIEVSVDETETPTSELEHLFFILELNRRGVKIVSLAPRFIGDFEKGIDYKGDLDRFEAALRRHVGIAQTYGPYKLSIHSGSDKFSIYPIIGRTCGELLHVKTAGTSYLEALRVVCRQANPLFREIVDYARSRFEEDRASYHISATMDDFRDTARLTEGEREAFYLDRNAGRQLLHVTFGSVLTRGTTAADRPFKDAIMEVLEREADLHCELLEAHLGRHIEMLERG